MTTQAVAAQAAPLTAAQYAQAHKLLSLAQSQLVLKHPFFAYLVLRHEIILGEGVVPTAGADARGRIYVNPRFLLGKHVGTTAKAVFLLAHEVLHIVSLHCHPATTLGRSKQACNIAMDKVINETLIAEKVGEFIDGGQRHPGAEKMTWEQLYQEGRGGGGGDDDDGGGGGGGIGDDLVPCPDGEPTGAEAEQLKLQAKADVAAAAQAAKMQGKLSANMARMVEEMVHVPTPWHSILERFMQGFVSSDYSWRRPNRRFAWQGLYLPSLDRVPRMGRVGIIGDTSGSVTQRMIDAFQAHTNRIIETCLPEEVVLLSVDDAVCNVQRFTVDEYPIKWEPRGFGGTDMRKGWQWFEDSGEEFDCIVCLTDGYTPWPDDVRTPSIVLSTTDQVAPARVGETVHFDPGV